MKKGLIILILIFVISEPFSQNIERFKETKNIYLLDVTLSMWGKSPGSKDIFDNVRNELIKAINSISNKNTEIVVVTFQDKILNTWSHYATTQGKKDLIKELNSIDPSNLKSTYTNILLPWKKGRDLIDPQKINVIFLLTDGQHTTIKPTKQDLYKEVRSWGTFAQNNDYYAFLVELGSQAQDNNLRNTIYQTPNAQIITGIEFFIMSVEDAYPVVNINENLSFPINLIGDRIDNIPNSFSFSIELNDPNFTLKNTDFILKNRPFQIELIANKTINELRNKLPQESTINAVIKYDKSKYPQIKLLSHSLSIKIRNKKEMILKIEVLD